MNENFISGEYDVTKKTKLRKFYDDYKILIFSIISMFILIIASFNIYSYLQNKKKITLSKEYVNAQIYLQKNNKNEALRILNEIINSNDATYSTLSLFEIVNEKLITDNEKVSELFTQVLTNNKFDKEVKNLIILKKGIFETSFSDEQKILKTLNPLINENTLWKPHALLLAGNYFASKGENIKARDFFTQILNIENLNKKFTDQAKYQLKLILND
jgi:hypothetical protein